MIGKSLRRVGTGTRRIISSSCNSSNLRVKRRGYASLQEHLVKSSVNSVLMDLEGTVINEPTTDMPQPKFSDFRLLQVKAQPQIRQELITDISNVDPFDLISKDVAQLSNNIKDLLGVDHPVLSTVAKYFFDQDGGKKMRPALVLLVARAVNNHAKTIGKEIQDEEQRAQAYAGQRRLAEIIEMIHTASLLHDDVIDVADTRRGSKTVNQVFGNKLAILAGDFLLARASVCSARLRNLQVVEILSTIIEHLVLGEVMQSRSVKQSDLGSSDAFEYYLKKNYYKTGSLISNSILASVILGGHDRRLQQIAFDYGESLGHAFQLVDDVLDFDDESVTGKPSFADLRAGLATAPVLLALDTHPELRKMIERKFSNPGDVERAVSFVQEGDSLQKTLNLATAYSEKAIESILQLSPSPERDALVHLAIKVVTRKK